MACKPPWESKTLWVNALALVGVAIDSLVGTGAVSHPQVVPWLLVGLALVNGALRLVTTEAVRL